MEQIFENKDNNIIVEKYIIVPSKANELTQEEVEYLFPCNNPPSLPKGIIYREKHKRWDVRRTNNGKRVDLIATKNIKTAIIVLGKFCMDNGQKMW